MALARQSSLDFQPWQRRGVPCQGGPGSRRSRGGCPGQGSGSRRRLSMKAASPERREPATNLPPSLSLLRQGQIKSTGHQCQQHTVWNLKVYWLPLPFFTQHFCHFGFFLDISCLPRVLLRVTSCRHHQAMGNCNLDRSAGKEWAALTLHPLGLVPRSPWERDCAHCAACWVLVSIGPCPQNACHSWERLTACAASCCPAQ